MSIRRIFNTISKRGYHEVITEHFNKPKNIGTLDKKDLNVGTGLVGSPACGDVIKLQIKVDENDKIIETKCKIFGCGSAIANTSFASELIKNKSLTEASQVTNMEIAKATHSNQIKLHCSSLAADAIQAAITDLKQKREKK